MALLFNVDNFENAQFLMCLYCLTRCPFNQTVRLVYMLFECGAFSEEKVYTNRIYFANVQRVQLFDWCMTFKCSTFEL